MSAGMGKDLSITGRVNRYNGMRAIWQCLCKGKTYIPCDQKSKSKN